MEAIKSRKNKKKKLKVKTKEQFDKAVKLLETMPRIQDLGLLGSLLYTYYRFEKYNGVFYGRAVTQAFLDFALLKSGTELGVGAALAHITGRGVLKGLEETFRNLKEHAWMTPWY